MGHRECAQAFPQLDDEQMDCVREMGSRREFADGEIMVSFGTRDYPMYVIESGRATVSASSSGQLQEIVTHGEREFLGDVDLLTGRPAIFSIKAEGACVAYAVDVPLVRRLLGQCPTMSDLLLEAFQTRRQLVEYLGLTGIRVIGKANSRDTNRMREFFYRNHVPHTFFDVNEDAGQQELASAEATLDDLPVVRCHEKINKKPALSKVAECLGISRRVDDACHDLVIVGAGPAGLAAAVYAASEGLGTVVLDSVGPGGQAGSSSKIENFMGFPSGISGAALANRGYLQALKFGATFTAPVYVRALEKTRQDEFHLRLCTDQTVRARCVLVATGVAYRQPHLENLSHFEGAGVYYSATTVEARGCRQSTAIVVGAGNSAGQAAMYLSQSAQRVIMVVRSDDLGKSMSAYLCDRIRQQPLIEVRYHTEVDQLVGDDSLETVLIRNNQTGEIESIACASLFLFIGAEPHSEWLPESVRRDEKGYVMTGSGLESDPLWPLDRPPCELETTLPGLMAAGDVRSGTTKRCGFAVGDGSLAVSCVHRYLGQLAR